MYLIGHLVYWSIETDTIFIYGTSIAKDSVLGQGIEPDIGAQFDSCEWIANISSGYNTSTQSIPFLCNVCTTSIIYQ